MGDHTSIKSSRKNFERIDKKLREISEVLNWDGLQFPVNLSDIQKFENHILQFLLMYSIMKNWFVLFE